MRALILVQLVGWVVERASAACDTDVMLAIDTSSSAAAEDALDLGKRVGNLLTLEGGHRILALNWGSYSRSGAGKPGQKGWANLGPRNQGDKFNSISFSTFQTTAQWNRWIASKRVIQGDTPMGLAWETLYKLYENAEKREGGASQNTVLWISDGKVNGVNAPGNQTALSDEYAKRFRDLPKVRLYCVYMTSNMESVARNNMLRWCGGDLRRMIEIDGFDPSVLDEPGIKGVPVSQPEREKLKEKALKAIVAALECQADPVTQPPRRITPRPTTPRVTQRRTTPRRTTRRITTTTQKTTTTTTKGPTGCELDLLLLVDFSGSVMDEVNMFKTMATKLVNKLQVVPDATRVAMMKYSSKGYVVPEFWFNTNEDKESVVTSVKQAQWFGGWTDSAGALRRVNEELDESNQPRRGFRSLRDTRGRVIMVLTDGYSQQDPKEAAVEVRRMDKTEVYAAGFDYEYDNFYAGKGTMKVNETQLIEIAGDRTRVAVDEREFDRLTDGIARKYNNNCKL